MSTVETLAGGRYPPAGRLWEALRSAAAGMVATRRAVACLAGLLVILGLTGARGLDLAFLEEVRLSVFDSYQRWSPRPAGDAPVAIVDVDDRALEAWGQWPWPRQKLAHLVDRLTAAGAAAIVFDMVFAEPDRTAPRQLLDAWAGAWGDAWDEGVLDGSISDLLERLPDPDERFAAAIARSPVVLGFGLTDRATARRPELASGFATVGPDPVPYLRGLQGAVTNLPVLEARARGQGSFSITTDTDEVIRRVPLFQTVDGMLVPSLAVEALRVAQGATTTGLRSRNAAEAASDGRSAGLETVRIGRIDVPVDPDGHLWVHYRRADPERLLSADIVLDPATSGDDLRARVGGRIVLIGTSAVGLKDLRATPLNPFEAGVVVHAEVLEQMLTGWFLSRPAWVAGLEICGSLVAGMLLIGVILRTGPGFGALAAMTVAGMIVILSWLAFTEARYLIDPTHPLLTLIAIYSSVTLVTHVFAERDKQAIKTAFTHYLAPAVVSRLTEDPGQLKLGGEIREMTFLFSDIAGFTSFTERTEPETLIRLLNRYLDGQCGIVMDHGGTVDKVVGDAVHAIFNAPLDQPDHAARAVRCALAMDRFSEAFLAERLQAELRFGKTRIGVNTGDAVIGNFGGSRRFDYTAHGDAINTAARLESVNKHLGTRICVAAATAAQSPDLRFRPIGKLVLKGKTTGIDTVEPITVSNEGYAPLPAYEEAFGALERGCPAAKNRFQTLADAYPDDPLVQLHARRAAEGDLSTTIILGSK